MNAAGGTSCRRSMTFYKLSDQKMPEPFAGEKVKVFGTLDPQTNMIQVQDIEPITK